MWCIASVLDMVTVTGFLVRCEFYAMAHCGHGWAVGLCILATAAMWLSSMHRAALQKYARCFKSEGQSRTHGLGGVDGSYHAGMRSVGPFIIAVWISSGFESSMEVGITGK